MKSLFLSIALAFITFPSVGQDIADIKVSNVRKLTVLDSNGDYISSKYLSANKELAGYSSTIIVIKSSSGKVTVYDQEFKRISSKYINQRKNVKSVVGNNIIFKSTSGKVTTYGKNLKYITSRYE